jgi:hypothetical protein
MHLDKDVHDQRCPACLFFNAMWHEPGSASLMAFSAAEMFRAAQHMMLEIPTVALGIFVSGNWTRSRIIALAKTKTSNAHASIHPTKAQPALEVATLNVSDVDYDRCKVWLQQCEYSHGQSCEGRDGPRRFSVPLTCIDCTTWGIGRIDDSDDYIALSYVWGASQSKIPGVGRCQVLANASQVIRDAIRVVTQLGKRYLWVDQYCVDQHNHDIRNAQIGEMDQIYAGAYATIVAAAGSNADYGLPGVSRPRSHKQSSLKVSRVELRSSLPDLFYAISDSAWRGQAWTYQEAVLSRRCLFFTEYQVYFVCPRLNQSEAVMLEGYHLQEQELPSLPQIDITQPDSLRNSRKFKDLSSFEQLAHHIFEYSRKTLTYETDGLNAFRGLLSRAQLHTFYGVPLFTYGDQRVAIDSNTHFDLGFAVGLLWSLQRDGIQQIVGKRRPQFPSWTWIGWKGRFGYDQEVATYTNYPKVFMELAESRFTRVETTFLLEDSSGTLSTFQDAIEVLDGTKMIPELQYSLIIDATVLQLRFRAQPRGMGYYVCQCHPNSEYEDGSPMCFTRTWGYVTLYEEHPIKQTMSKIWNCVCLFENITGQHKLMVIKWVDEVAYRVGDICSEKNVGWPDVPRRRKRIRMM